MKAVRATIEHPAIEFRCTELCRVVDVVDLHRHGPQVGQHLVNQSKRYIGLVGCHFGLTLDVLQEPIDQLRSLNPRPSAVRE